MSDDPIMRVPTAFGRTISRLRDRGSLSNSGICKSSGIPVESLEKILRGESEPSLTEFFWIARALREEPAMLFIELISVWRGDGTDSLYKSRPSDFVRLYRLGYYHKAGDFREQERTYHSAVEATNFADRLNEQRAARGVALLGTLCIYVRMQCTHLIRKPGSGRTSNDE
jgi:transcriptional regulator with XRE-family HTH domain